MSRINLLKSSGMINCNECGRSHDKKTSNCCWISCECGNKICGNCGSVNIQSMDIDPDDTEAQYWCCKECVNCGLTGCAMSI